MSLIAMISAITGTTSGEPPPSGYTYELQQVAASTAMDPQDGIGLVSHAGLLKSWGGWFVSDQSHSQVWHCADGGVTWVRQTDAPWHKRHTFGHGVDSAGVGWVWGGDMWYNGVAPKNVWKLDGTWSQVTADWGSGVGLRVLFSWAIDEDDYKYIAGGQQDYVGVGTTIFTDIWRSLDGVTWTKLCDLPAGLDYFSAGTMIVKNGKIWLMGGARYNSTGHDNYNSNIYLYDIAGNSWSTLATNATLKSMYCNSFYWDGFIWYLLGYDQARGGNLSGLYQIDMITGDATLLSNAYPARHATGICVHNDELFFACGNLHDDVWKVAKVLL